jgi:predicted nuclease with TOPRIM domain
MKNIDLQNQINNQASEINNLKSENHNLKNRVSSLEGNVSSLQLMKKKKEQEEEKMKPMKEYLNAPIARRATCPVRPSSFIEKLSIIIINQMKIRLAGDLKRNPKMKIIT